MDVFDAHRFVDGFAHIVNGQRCDRYRGQSLHFDAGLSGDFCRCSNDYAILFNFELHFAMGDRQWMTKRNQFAGFFSGTDGGDARGGEHIAFGDLVFLNSANSCQLQNDFAGSECLAQHDRFCRNIDHARLAPCIDVSQLGHQTSIFFRIAPNVKRSHAWNMELVTVFKTFNPAEAEVIRSQLETAGIPAEVMGNDAVFTGMSGPVLVQVSDDQAQQARELIEAPEEPPPDAGPV